MAYIWQLNKMKGNIKGNELRSIFCQAFERTVSESED